MNERGYGYVDALIIPRWIMELFEFKASQLYVYSYMYQMKYRQLNITMISKNTCCSLSTARSAVHELMEKGYVTCSFKDGPIKWYELNKDFIPEEYR